MVGKTLGHYEILEPLGTGGMGEVYRALDTTLKREVAIKVLPEEFITDKDRLARLEREAHLLASLNHPNIATIHSLEEAEGSRFLVLELVKGESLEQQLAKGALPLEKALDVGKQIAAALEAAHGEGIIHRDLKPANVLITPDGRAKVLDFGIAKSIKVGAEVAETAKATDLTVAGTLLGTPAYMSPEQVRGEPVDQRTDIWAFGCVLYEMLTGHRPFERPSAIETMVAILQEPAPTPDELPAGMRDFLMKALAKAPDERPPSFTVVLTELAHLAAEPSALDTPSGWPKRTGFVGRDAEQAELGRLLGAEVARPRRAGAIAVLPFKDLAGDAENAHIGLGLAEATIAELARFPSVVVRPTASILRYTESATDPVIVGHALSVDMVVEGSVQRSGSRLRVTVQLISVAEARPVWSTKVTTEFDDIFEVQDKVARQIIEALGLELAPATDGRGARASRTSGTAYEHYLKGRFKLVDLTLDNVNSAIGHFEEARDLDPNFAPAWAALADAYLYLHTWWHPGGDWHARAEKMCAKALELDESLPEARLQRLRLMWGSKDATHGWDHAGAIRECLAVLSARPNLNEARRCLGIVLFHVGLIDEAIDELEQGLSIQPDDVNSTLWIAYALSLQVSYERALELLASEERRTPEVWTKHQMAFYLRAFCDLRLGHTENAARVIEQATRQFPNTDLFHPISALIAAVDGDAQEAERHIELGMQNEVKFVHYHHSESDLASVHAVLGDGDRAVEYIERAANHGFPCCPWFESDPLLESVRGDGRYIELIERLKEEAAVYRALYRELSGTNRPD